jgi:hypothetical protein
MVLGFWFLANFGVDGVCSGKLRKAADRWLGGDRTVFIRCNTMQVSAASETGEGAEGSVTASGQRAERQAAQTHLAVSQTIKQVVRVCSDETKIDNLVALLKSILRRPDEIDRRQPSAVLVFCTRIKTVRKAHKHLEDLGVRSGQLHGQLAQPLREKALADFKAGAVSTATDTTIRHHTIHAACPAPFRSNRERS